MQKIAKETCRVVPLLAAAMGLLLMPLAAGADELEDEHELSMEFVTPHTKWAKPYAGPKVRVLFFYRLVTHYNWAGGAAAREIIELMQRFDLEGDAAYYGPEEWLGGEAGHERILGLLKGAFRPRKPYDVYVFSQVSPDLLTEEERDIVFEAVKEGAGLLMIGASGGGVLTSENRLQERPAFLSAGECYRVGKGRGVSMPVQEVGYRVGWEVELDYQMEHLGRALLWAAGRVPQMGLEVKVSSSQIERGTLPATAATVSWTKAMPATRLQVELRRWDGQKTAIGSPECSPPEGTARFRIPVLRAGDYHIDAIARSERGIESWGDCCFYCDIAENRESSAPGQELGRNR